MRGSRASDEHERRRARARRRARLAQAAARELVDEGAQAEIRSSVAGIVCGVVPADLVLLHGFTQTGASWDGVVRELAGRYRALAPDLGAGPWEAELDRLEALAPPRVHARRLLDGRAARAGARAADPGAGASGSCWCPRARGWPTPASAPRGGRPTRRWRTRIEAIGVEAFAREWAAQPLFAGQPAEVAAAAHEDRLRRSAAEHAAQLRGLGTGVMPPLWDRLGELAMPVTLVVGERDAKFRAIARAHGASRAELVVVPGAGHAVHLEAPGRASRRTCAVP